MRGKATCPDPGAFRTIGQEIHMRLGHKAKVKDIIGTDERGGVQIHDAEVSEVMSDLADWYWSGVRFIEEEVG